ncbi:MAG: GNAT family N-acetyltransferase [Planctomycetota bacterium]
MVQLRPVQESDFPAVERAFLAAFELTSPPDPDYVANLCYSHPAGCLVATDDRGEVVGYASSHRAGSVGYLGNLGVLPAHQGEGHGKALTVAARDQLAGCCEVVGLAVDPGRGRNLELYSSRGFVPTLPSAFVWKPLASDRSRGAVPAVRSARELGAEAADAVERVGAWLGELVPGLELGRDLERFVAAYPDRLWFELDGAEVRGFLAYEGSFRGDPFGAVRPGADEAQVFAGLVRAVEAAVDDEALVFHYHTCFGRLQPLFRELGYRTVGHKTNMVLGGRSAGWPVASEALLLRPWWS